MVNASMLLGAPLLDIVICLPVYSRTRTGASRSSLASADASPAPASMPGRHASERSDHPRLQAFYAVLIWVSGQLRQRQPQLPATSAFHWQSRSSLVSWPPSGHIWCDAARRGNVRCINRLSGRRLLIKQWLHSPCFRRKRPKAVEISSDGQSY